MNILSRLILGFAVLIGSAGLCPCGHSAGADVVAAMPAPAEHHACCHPSADAEPGPTDHCPSPEGPEQDCPHCGGHAEAVGCQPGHDAAVLGKDQQSYPLATELPIDLPVEILDFDAAFRAAWPTATAPSCPAPTLRAQRCLLQV